MRKVGLLQNLIIQTGLEVDSVSCQPLIEIAGNTRVLIENHKGIISYNCSEVCVRVCSGFIVVCGEKLILAEIQKDRLVICGRILNVSLGSGGTV